jgi:hypothetical protein
MHRSEKNDDVPGEAQESLLCSDDFVVSLALLTTHIVLAALCCGSTSA